MMRERVQFCRCVHILKDGGVTLADYGVRKMFWQFIRK